MTTTTENQTAKTKQVPDFYIFENGANGEKGGKPAGAAFRHKKGKGFTLLIGGKRFFMRCIRYSDTPLKTLRDAGFPLLAKNAGAKLVIVNNEPTEQDDLADLVIRYDIGETLGPFVGN